MTNQKSERLPRWDGSSIYPQDNAAILRIAESMRQHGYWPDKPILLFEGGVLDGWHRYQAALRADVEPVFKDFEGDELAAFDLILLENGDRRHLTPSQQAAAAIVIAREQAALGREPEDAQRIAANTGLAPASINRLSTATSETLHEVALGNMASSQAMGQSKPKPKRGNVRRLNYAFIRSEQSRIAGFAITLDKTPKEIAKMIVRAGLDAVERQAQAAAEANGK